MASPASTANAPVRLLALGTSTEWCSVALIERDGGVLRVRTADEQAGQAQSKRLLPMAQTLLADVGLALSDLDAVAFDTGPGSFTGLRIGCGVAQGLGFALGLPLVPVGALEAIALQSGVSQAVVAMDARMNELYCGAYRIVEGLAPEAILPARVLPLADASRELPSWFEAFGTPGARVCAGDGCARHAELAACLAGHGVSLVHATHPGAESIARLGLLRFERGEAIDARDAAPSYVRDKVALDVDEQRALRAARAAGRL